MDRFLSFSCFIFSPGHNQLGKKGKRNKNRKETVGLVTSNKWFEFSVLFMPRLSLSLSLPLSLYVPLEVFQLFNLDRDRDNYKDRLTHTQKKREDGGKKN